MSSVIQVATEAQFAAAIAAVAAAASGSVIQIVVAHDIALAPQSPVIAVPDGVQLAIDGQGHSFYGQSTSPGLDIASGTVALSDLSIDDASTSGSGGGLLVGGLANVTLDQVSFTADQAVVTDGGSAEGGAIFVTAGGSLTYDSGSVSGNPTPGGGIFLQGAESISFAPGAGQTVTVADPIADQSGSGGTGLNAGIGSLAKSGAGTLVLGGDNRFTGDVTVTDGVLDLENSNAAGAGTIVLAGSGAGLVIGSGVVLQSQISGFAPGNFIDLAGIGLIGQAAIGPGDVLTAGAVTLAFTGDYTGMVVETRSDQNGGTDLLLEPAPPTLADTSGGGLPGTPTFSGDAPAGSLVTLFDGLAAIGTAQAAGSGLWSITPASPLDDGLHSLTASFVDPADTVSATSAAVLVDVTLGQGYDVRAPSSGGTMNIRHYDPSGALAWVEVADARGLVLQAVDGTEAVTTVYDAGGAAIASIAEPVISANAAPSATEDEAGNTAYLSTGTVGSTVRLLGDQVVLTTHGPDSVMAGAGSDSIFAGGPSVTVVGGAAALLFVGNDGASTVTGASGGGAGSATLYGGTGGGWLEGGSGGQNVLVASAGNTTLVGGGSGDRLVAGDGSTEILASPGATAFGGAGGSTVYGAADAVMVGGSGGTEFVCGAGAESCYGGSGRDVFFTGSGTALIQEGPGADFVGFGAGAATVTGGAGVDRYDFANGSAGGTAVIAGFKNGTDRLELTGYAPGSMRSGTDGGNTVIALSDGTRITLLGMTGLAAGSIV